MVDGIAGEDYDWFVLDLGLCLKVWIVRKMITLKVDLEDNCR